MPEAVLGTRYVSRNVLATLSLSGLASIFQAILLWSIPVARVAGITVHVHWSWFAVAAIASNGTIGHYREPIFRVIEYFGLFAIVLLHEFGHALGCRLVGGRADSIALCPLGGVAFMNPPGGAIRRLWCYAAGPLVNVLLIVILLKARGMTAHWPKDPREVVKSLYWINIGLLLINMFPVFPLDGGQMLRAAIWLVCGEYASLLIASCIGIAGAVGFAAFAWKLQSWGLAILAAFAGVVSYLGLTDAAVELTRNRRKLKRREARCPACKAAPAVGPYWACRCGQLFDTFEAGGICPRCGRVHEARCHSCGKASPRAAWSIGAEEHRPFTPASVSVREWPADD